MVRTFSWNFKLKAVNLAEVCGVKAAARKLKIAPKSIREWRQLKKPIEQLSRSQKIPEPTHYFTLNNKLNAVKYANKNGAEAAAQKYNVGLKTIQEWCSGCDLKDSLKRVITRKTHPIDAFKKCLSKKLENQLAFWIVEQQKKNMLLTEEIVKTKVLQLLTSNHKEYFYDCCENENFNFHTWFQGFLKSKKLNLINIVPAKIEDTKSIINSLEGTTCYLKYFPSIVKVEQKSDTFKTPDSDLVKNELFKSLNTGDNKLKKQISLNNVLSHDHHSCNDVMILTKDQVSVNESVSLNSTPNILIESHITIKKNDSLLQNSLFKKNHDQVPVKISESFSRHSLSIQSSSSELEIEKLSKKISCAVQEQTNNVNETVHPISIEGLIACIAFQTYFQGKHTCGN